MSPSYSTLLQQRTVAPFWLEFLLDAALRAGVDLSGALIDLGVSNEDLENPQSRIAMTVEDQLIRLGNHRYVFLFDLPVEPGERSLRVYWSDGMHRTIDASMQTVKVVVEDADSGKK